MSQTPAMPWRPWRRAMSARDIHEPHRASTPLELFYDLCFVIAVATAAAELHHAMSSGHGLGIRPYLLVFFAIWWAWMNFTWFASAYDPDDTPYRLCVFIQILGVLILAAGVAPAFEESDYRLVFAGYVVMRIGLETQRIRAAVVDPAGRVTMRRYVIGESGALIGWAAVIFGLDGGVALVGWVLMAVVELLVPIWAESGAMSSWHPHHISERYGLFTIIVLGESLLAASTALRSALDEKIHFGELASVVAGGLLIVFSIWWLYFSKPVAHLLNSARMAFFWGYGHYVIFASVAAVGAGIASAIDQVTGHSHLHGYAAGGIVTVPVALYLCVLWLIHVRPLRMPPVHQLMLPLGAVAVLAVGFTGEPVLATGLVLAVLTAATVVMSTREYSRATADS